MSEIFVMGCMPCFAGISGVGVYFDPGGWIATIKSKTASGEVADAAVDFRHWRRL